MIAEVFVCPEHGQVGKPGPSGVCTVPQAKVIESRFVCGRKVVRYEVEVDTEDVGRVPS